MEKKTHVVIITDLERLSKGGVIQSTLIKNILKGNNVKLFDVNQDRS